jgi:hypothetical protein
MLNQRSTSLTRTYSNQYPFTDPLKDAEREAEARKIKYNFWWFAVIASLNHALNYVVNSYATSLLSPSLGGIILGLSWVLNSVSGMTVATAIVIRFGFKYAMIISLFGYALQLGTLLWAVLTPDITTSWIVAIIGSVVAGFTSAIWWTAQGVYFDDVCVRIDDVLTKGGFSKVSRVEEVRAEIAAHWTFIYQMADIVVFLCLSVFPMTRVVSINGVLGGLTVLGAVTAMLGFTFETVGKGAVELSWSETAEAIVAVPKQFRDDARVSLLAPFVFGFGITTAMFAYYVNANVVSDSSDLGTVTLGFLEAWSYFVAVISAYPYAYVANNIKKGQDWVIQFGSLAFLATGAVVLGLSNSQLGTWQNILIAKGLYGLGRGVFEGSCRAVYATMFTGKDLTTAFSGQTLSAGFSGGICFFLFGVLNRTSIAAITVINGVVAISSYFILMYRVNGLKRVSWSQVCLACCCACFRTGEDNDESVSQRKYSQARSHSSLSEHSAVHSVYKSAPDDTSQSGGVVRNPLSSRLLDSQESSL